MYVFNVDMVSDWLDTFEPWIKGVKWNWHLNQDYSIHLNCTSLEANSHYCHDNPCSNNGSCYGGLTTFYCDCMPGWAGKICDEESK